MAEKWLHSVAKSGNYEELENLPDSLPANGGNADTVDNKRVDDSTSGADIIWTSNKILAELSKKEDEFTTLEPTVIKQNSNHRFVTDEEKIKWNSLNQEDIWKGGTFTGKVTFNDMLDVSGNINMITNAKYIYATNLEGSKQKILGCSSSGNLVIGDEVTKHDSINLYSEKFKHNGTDVIGYGSNKNGSYVKFYNGVMIAWNDKGFDDDKCDTNTAIGSLFYGKGNITFPAAFKEIPAMSYSARSGSDIIRWCTSQSVSTTTAVCYIVSPSKSLQKATAYWTAIGKWK